MLLYTPLYAKVEEGRDFSRITTIDKSGLLEITYVWDDGRVRVAARKPLSSLGYRDVEDYKAHCLDAVPVSAAS